MENKKTSAKLNNNEIAISVKNVSKTFRIPHEKITSIKGAVTNVFSSGGYEEFKALDNVSFEVKKGEFFGIIGRNGSGKSTLLKILAGIYQADKGKVKVNGMISPFLELGIGFNPELSGRDNVYLNATVLGMTKKQIDEKFDSIVKFSELERFIDQKLKNYSSGMQVRLAFSVSIHANRDILLMDEVLAVGDSNFQSKCLEEFNKYREMGRTVVIVTHDISVVERYCDRAMLLRNGNIIKIGKSDRIVNEYIMGNMEDEEVRISKMDSVNNFIEDSLVDLDSVGKSKVKKSAEVIRVEFLNKEDCLKNIFETGELIRIDVYYNFHKEIKNPIFGIIIKDIVGNNVFALNTLYKKIKTGNISCGEVVISFLIKNYFSTGIYRISPAIATENRNNIDWRDNFKSFRVINKEFNSNAIADFETNIIIKK